MITLYKTEINKCVKGQSYLILDKYTDIPYTAYFTGTYFVADEGNIPLTDIVEIYEMVITK